MKAIRILAGTLTAGLFLSLLGTLPRAAAQTAASEDGVTAAVREAGDPAPVSFAYPTEEAMLAAMQRAAENAACELYYDPATLAVAVRLKASGAVFTSNPYNAAADPYCSGNIEKAMESQAVVNYVDDKNVKGSLWSSADCVELGQFAVKAIAGGVRFDLSVGREQQQYIVPEQVPAARFEALLAKLSEDDQDTLTTYYEKYALDAAASQDERRDLLEQYPGLAKGDLYATFSLSEREKGRLEAVFEAAGYTLEDLQADAEALGLTVEEAVFPNFRFALEYRLTDDGVRVTIPNDSVQYDRAHFALLSIQVLPYFGAVPAAEDGYLFIPDGCGALIATQGQNENRRRTIAGRVYGLDAAVIRSPGDQEGMAYYLPVFGVKRGNGTAALAIVESGDEVSEITAVLGEPNSAFYTVSNTFRWTTEETIAINTKVGSTGSGKKVTIYDANTYQKDFTVAYHLLTGDQADYTGMAQAYRAHLIAQGMPETGEAGLALGLETLGTALYDKDFFGFPYQADAAFTPYERNLAMLDELRAGGVAACRLTLTGWRRDGLDAGIANRVELSGALGGRSGFDALVEGARQRGVALYPDADMLFVSADHWFDGFRRNRDAARLLTREFAGDARFRPETQQYGALRYAISPRRYADVFAAFFEDYAALGTAAVSLGTVGERLNSDFNTANAANRGQTRDLLDAELAKLRDRYALTFRGGNAYVLPYASLLRGTPLSHSGYLGETAAVPFLQMAVSGSIPCESTPLNLEEDQQTLLLRCIESRTSPAYVLAAQNVLRLKQTAYSYYYAVSYEVLRDKVIAGYQYVAGALKAAGDARIVRHDILQDGVARTTYANGTRIYVNYNEQAYSDGTVTVAPHGYAVAGR